MIVVQVDTCFSLTAQFGYGFDLMINLRGSITIKYASDRLQVEDRQKGHIYVISALPNVKKALCVLCMSRIFKL